MQNTNFNSEGTKLNAKNSSFDYIAMQFRLHQRVAMSIGLLPYSSVGYNMAKANNDVASEEARSVTSFAGDGGLHQLYVGLGVKSAPTYRTSGGRSRVRRVLLFLIMTTLSLFSM